MIGRLTGRVIADEADGTLVVDVRGVGYEVSVAMGTLGRAQQNEVGETILFIHSHVREDAFTLFGFSSEEERAAFRMLLSVASIGPKTALGVLGTLPAAELATAIDRKDVTRLVRVPGIGKKTAERMVLELFGKLKPGRTSSLAGPPQPSSRRSEGPEGALLFALTSMGYKPAEAERVVGSLGERVQTETIATLVKEALGMLAK